MQNPDCRSTVNTYFPKGIPTTVLFLSGEEIKRVRGVVDLVKELEAFRGEIEAAK